jgi:hypothetical protein
MNIGRKRNRHYGWLRFVAQYEQPFTEAGLPLGLIQSEHRLRDLLRDGATKIGGEELLLKGLTEAQWVALKDFAQIFFQEFESCMPLDLFPAFRSETECRNVGRV